MFQGKILQKAHPVISMNTTIPMPKPRNRPISNPTGSQNNSSRTEVQGLTHLLPVTNREAKHSMTANVLKDQSPITQARNPLDSSFQWTSTLILLLLAIVTISLLPIISFLAPPTRLRCSQLTLSLILLLLIKTTQTNNTNQEMEDFNEQTGSAATAHDEIQLAPIREFYKI